MAARAYGRTADLGLLAAILRGLLRAPVGEAGPAIEVGLQQVATTYAADVAVLARRSDDETFERTVQALGVTLGQGYLLGRPARVAGLE